MNSRELGIRCLCVAWIATALICWPARGVAAAPRTTLVDVSRPDTPVRIVRTRELGKAQAVFAAESRAIEPGSYIRFRIHSEGRGRVMPRWSCVATQNVAECFEEAVKVRYRVGDERVVLTVTAGYAKALSTPDPDADPAVAAAR